jgi:uncharacterized protein
VRDLQKEHLNGKKTNRLIHERSPYLIQHAYNPVDWYPWGQEAFDKAKAEDKPIFVSIGYSSCHWCHIMEKECFEDVEVATLMNMAFVCVKVDREERPDVDATYMAVCQAMGRSCGWPLNVLLTPNKKPFFAASYIPKNNRFGAVGMLELIPQIMEIWRIRRADLELTGDNVLSRIESSEQRISGKELGKEVLDDAYEKLVMDFDDENGGFSDAPKFPRPHSLLFLLRYYRRTGEKNALAMVEKTLRQMRFGGMFDQIGFGFHRYSTDSQWLVPHFEKMLYDQALLSLAYIEAFQVTGALKYKVTAKETIEYVLRDLTSPQGGFYSSEDADSEGEEGKFYLWTKQEIRETVHSEDVDLATQLFGVEAQGNYYDPASRGRNGLNILHLHRPLEEIALESVLTIDELIVRLGRIRNALFEARKQRIAPAKDDKILTDWNGLMIAAVAKASQAFNDQQYLSSAEKAADFILKDLTDEDGKLYHCFAKGEKTVDAFLDDYAFFTFGLIELYEASFEEKYLQAATSLTKSMISRFWDQTNGGFYLTQENPKESMIRIKQIYDGAIPSGNSVALLSLLRLAQLTNDAYYEELASKIMRLFSEEIEASPTAFTYTLAGVDFAIGPTSSIIIVGDIKKKDTLDMLSALRKMYLPNLTVSLKMSNQETNSDYKQLEGKATAYVCRNKMCMPPTTSIPKVLELLDAH